jgi:peroxiredoxin
MRLVIPKPWMQYVLIIAGLYNIAWGCIAIINPAFFCFNTHLSIPDYPAMWRGIGLLAILFGIGFLIASRRPFRHWPIIFIGFVCKITSASVFFYYLSASDVTMEAFPTILANDIIWLIPFALILYYAFDHAQSQREIGAYDLSPRKLKSLDRIHTQDGISLQELSDRSPTMLIFLRYFGCPFCRESLKEIASKKEFIEHEGTKIVLVHMISEDEAKKYLDHFGLKNVYTISDPQKKLYKAFGLKKGTLFQLFGINVMLRGLKAIVDGHLIGKFKGDPFQLPGIFLIHKGSVLQTFRHTSAADRPDYIELAKAEIFDIN